MIGIRRGGWWMERSRGLGLKWVRWMGWVGMEVG